MVGRSACHRNILDERGATRVSCPRRADLVTSDGSRLPVYVVNVSTTGLAAISRMRPPVGRFSLDLDPLGHIDFACQAQTTWYAPTEAFPVHRFGIRFCDPQASFVTRLRKLVTSLEQRTRLCYPEPETNEQLAAGTEIAAVAAVQLPRIATAFVEHYQAVSERDPFLWSWVWHALGVTTLSCIDENLFDQAREIKFLGVMLDTNIDDVADGIDGVGQFDELAKIPLHAATNRPEITDQQDRRTQLEALWSEMSRRLYTLPRYREFADLLQFDHQQLINSMRYACLLREHPERLNSVEDALYQPPSMYVSPSATIDLMASPTFNINEIGRVRAAVQCTQAMGRIANMLTTWQREVHQRDFTSGIFALAVEQGVLSQDDLRSSVSTEIEARILASSLEQELVDRWAALRQALRETADNLQSVDLGAYATAHDHFFRMHLGCWGLI